jgi:hypothetical protein
MIMMDLLGLYVAPAKGQMEKKAVRIAMQIATQPSKPSCKRVRSALLTKRRAQAVPPTKRKSSWEAFSLLL